MTRRVVLVTGGTRGIGAGTARCFADQGDTVVVCSRTAAEATIGEHIAADVRDAGQVTGLIDEIVRRHGRLDVVVNNAGGGPYALAADAGPALHRKILELNLLAPLTVSVAANAVMQTQETGGVIVMISSVSGSRPSPGTAAYGAAKAGIDSLAASLAIEWAPRVRVTSIAVGMVNTERSAQHYGDVDAVAEIAATVPLERLATPSDVGNAAVFLSSSLASYCSGSTLVLHGGGERPAFLSSAPIRDGRHESGMSA